MATKSLSSETSVLGFILVFIIFILSVDDLDRWIDVQTGKLHCCCFYIMVWHYIIVPLSSGKMDMCQFVFYLIM